MVLLAGNTTSWYKQSTNIFLCYSPLSACWSLAQFSSPGSTLVQREAASLHMMSPGSSCTTAWGPGSPCTGSHSCLGADGYQCCANDSPHLIRGI